MTSPLSRTTLALLLPFLLVSTLTLTPTPARAYTLMEMVDIFLTAVGSQSPDPGLGTLLAGAQSVKPGLMLRCQTKLQAINRELGQNPSRERVEELYDQLDRHQAVIAALNGKPAALNNWEKYKQQKDRKRVQKNQLPSKADLNKEEQQNMADQIARYRKKIQGIRSDCEKDIRLSIKLKKELLAATTAARKQLQQRKEHFGLLNYFNQSKKGTPCDDIRALEKKINAFAVLIREQEKKYNETIALAQKRLATCNSNGDVAFIKSSFQQAKQQAAQMETDYRELVQLFERRNRLGLAYEQTKEDFNQKARKLVTEELAELNRKETALKAFPDKFARVSGVLKPASRELKSIEQDILDAEGYYLPRYPQARADWDALKTFAANTINEVEGECDTEGTTRKVNKYFSSTADARNYMQRQKNLRLTDCDRDTLTDRAKNEAEWLKNKVLLNLAVNDTLPQQADACSARIAQTPASAPPLQQPPSPPTSPPAAPTPPANPPAPATTPTPQAGGLFIAGKAQLISGEGATYSAQDGAGTPYRSGVSWNSSVEDVFVMGSQGSGVAFKAGTSTIIAHKDDLVAYFDVKVVARVPNLVGREVQEAMGMLQGLGLDGGLPIEVPIKQKRKVTGQSVAAGTLAEANTLIVLEVSPTATGSEPESKPGNRQPASVFSTQGGESKEQRGTSGFSSSGGEEKPTATAPPASAPAADAGGINLLGTQTASQDCGQLQSSFDAALDLGDTLWAQSLLDEGRKCGFSAAGASRLNQLQAEQDLQEEQRLAEKCSAAEKRFYASLNGNKLQSAQQLLPALQTCPCYSQALAELGQRRKKQQCAQLSQQFNRQIANHRVSQARATVQQAQAAGCPINLSAAEGALDRAQQEVAQAEERRRAQQLQQQRRQAQQQQQLLNAMQGLFQSVQQQQQHSSHSGPTSNRVPPVTTPAPTSSPSAPSRPQKNCQKVCVREKVVWKNISDGRDHLCAGGVPRPPGPGLKPPRCEKTVHCLQWETRCQ